MPNSGAGHPCDRFLQASSGYPIYEMGFYAWKTGSMLDQGCSKIAGGNCCMHANVQMTAFTAGT
jgi:hypothetical protein